MFSVADLYVARVVSETGSIHAAAKILHKTQPAVSQTIKRLEKMVGFELFDRSGYRVCLTRKGGDFLQQSDVLISNEARLREYASVLCKEQESRVSISAFPFIGERLLLPVLKRIHEQYPETMVYIDYEESLGAFDQVGEGRVDMAVFPYQSNMAHFANLEAHTIEQLAFTSVIAPSLLGDLSPDAVPRDQFSQWKQISMRNAYSGKSYSFGANRGGRRWEVNDQRMSSTLIYAGLGWGILPHASVAVSLEKGDLIELPIPGVGSRISANIIAARPYGKVMGPVASRLWEMLLSTGIKADISNPIFENHLKQVSMEGGHERSDG